ncbi:MAG TPA: FKBP-type peptidyl-prolyl cis-trans isomerase [Gemmatimonadota bacterium]|nr:FKBP-type peptidyl-prolyl cis-trans isomerase [Gemmatimonadota bacterium]
MRSFFRGKQLIGLVLMALMMGCSMESPEAGVDAALETDDEKASYGIGLNIGQGLVPLAERIDVNSFAMGLRDALAEADPAVPQEELHELLNSLQVDLQQAQQQATAAEADANQARADSFLTANAEREGVTTTESGLQYEVMEQGDGPRPGPEDAVTVNYRGTLIDGTQFDSSYDRGEPATFNLGGVIPGFAEGIQLMPVGSKYKLFLPPEIGYGPQGGPGGGIAPNSALIFEIELLEIAE